MPSGSIWNLLAVKLGLTPHPLPETSPEMRSRTMRARGCVVIFQMSYGSQRGFLSSGLVQSDGRPLGIPQTGESRAARTRHPRAHRSAPCPSFLSFICWVLSFLRGRNLCVFTHLYSLKCAISRILFYVSQLYL